MNADPACALPDPASIRLTSFSHGGGCGCKIAPGVLSEILRSSAGGLVPRELLVGIETADDAAVWKLNDEQALVATTDFFMPIVDDAYDFGRIAATNAISDVYAMGGRPILALATADLGDKEAVLASGGDAFFTIPHFDGYAAVLVQLDRIPADALKAAIEDAWGAVAPAAVVERYSSD